MDSNYSLADIQAATGNGFGGNNMIWIVFLLLITFGGFGGMGWGGGANGALTRAEMQQGFDTQEIVRKLDGLTYGMCDSTYALNNSILTEGRALQQQISDCCCETRVGISNLAALNNENASKVMSAVHEEGEKTRALIQQNEIQALRDKLADVQLAQSQCAQNTYLVNTLRPCATPAYIVGNPYCGYNPYGTCYNV